MTLPPGCDERLAAGELDDDEARRILALVEADPTLATELVQRARLHLLLRVFHEDEAVAAARAQRALTIARAPSGASAVFARRVMRRLPSRRRVQMRWLAGAAAALLMVITGWWLIDARTVAYLHQGGAIHPIALDSVVNLAPGDALTLRADGSRCAAVDTVQARIVRADPPLILIQRGRVQVDATPRRHGGFTLRSNTAEATVLGTRFHFDVESTASHLNVDHGLVAFTRLHDGRRIEVGAGGNATTVTADLLVPPTDHLLLPAQARLSGIAWTMVDDPSAPVPRVLQAITGANDQGVGRATWRVRVRAGIPYRMWVLGCALAPEAHPKRGQTDAVLVQLPAGARCRGNGQSADRFLANGWAQNDGYWWVGGDGDRAQRVDRFLRRGEPGWDALPLRDEPPATIIFADDGEVELSLSPFEGPVAIAALWLTTSPSPRPAPNQLPSRP